MAKMKWKQCFIRQLRVLRLNRYSLTDSCDTMSEQDNKPKQRRNVGDKMKDLYNTYVRNEEMAEHETSKTEQSASDTTEQEVAMAENVADDTVARLTKERDELREQLVRQVAELDNYRRRSLKEKDELREYANQHLLLKMLPIIDDLHAALDVAAKSTHDAVGFQKGVEMIYHKAVKIFEDAGVRVIEDAVGQPFNVEVHEALAQLPSEMPEGHVSQLVQRGYYLRDKVLRHAKVITSAGT
jgi:molecular chaperone GrpE